MPYLPADQRVTHPGPNGPVTLTARVWALLADAEKAIGLKAGTLVVTQGSWHHGTQSGSTHDGGGAFDLRVWNIPAAEVEPLVVELRKRNVCAWKRDKQHGGFDPHIHGIVRDEADLSRGARAQVIDYDGGRDGLSAGGKDYHPRPVQHPFVYGEPPAPWGGRNLGWGAGTLTLKYLRPQVLTAQRCLRAKETGTYLPIVDGDFRARIERYAKGHLTASKHDGNVKDDGVTLKQPGAIGPYLYASMLTYYPA